MTRRTLLKLSSAMGLILASLPVWAEEWPEGTLRLTAAQIEQLLSGNTSVGSWSGTPYRQFFSETGRTVYLAQSSPPDAGKWRVNPETDEYESWWERGGWAGYTIVITNDGYAWVNGDSLEPFEVLAGDRLGG